jgi:hypothetical protein
MLVVVVLDGLCSWRLPCRKTPAAGFPRKLAVLRFCLYNPSISKMSIGTLCARQPVVLTGSHRSRFWFWTDILRPLVSFSSPLQEVGILCVCLCLVIFLSNFVLCRTDVLVHPLCMIPKDAWLFARCRTYISVHVLALLLALPRMVHVPC